MDLFGHTDPAVTVIRERMVLLRRFASEAELLPLIERVARDAPFRHMLTPGGHRMSVAMTNCGQAGWVSGHRGYRYAADDPETGQPWPAMPDAFLSLAQRAAEAGGFGAFAPDACLMNRYEVGSRLTAHQERNERDFARPIVSVSLGLPATFFVTAGEARSGAASTVPLMSGDVVVWGGPARLAFHGVRELKPGTHPACGPFRFNLTFRRAG